MTPDEDRGVSLLADRVRAGDVQALARAITLVENETAEGVALLRALFGATGQARLIGVTGPPGAGKSTLVDRLTAAARKDSHKVGVIAVDPTSPFSGGAMLGDRVRMGRHSSDAGVFIRSMASRGQLGGVARTTADVAEVMDASGAAVVFIETVGVGQAEVEIVRTADVSIVVFAPGSGDEVQTLKAGIMEIADIFVVNQSDRAGADQLAAAIGETQALRMPGPEEWRPPIVKTIATTGEGVAEVWDAIQQCWARREKTVGDRRRLRHGRRLRELLGDRLLARLDARLPPGELERVVDRIAARAIDPYAAADELIDRASSGAPQAAVPESR